MQVIKLITRLILIFSPLTVFCQSTYLLQGSKDYIFIDRLEIKQQRNTDLNFSTLKPYSRKAIVREVEYLDSARLGYADSTTGIDRFREWTDLNLTRTDEYNLRSLMMNNSEWVTGSKDDFQSKRPILKSFYKTKPNLLEVNTKDFFLALNPVIQIQQAVEPGYDASIFLNSRGVTARGMIANRVGFSAFITENQERGPQFVQNYIAKNKAVPGAGFYKKFKNTGVDYFDARGYITFNAAKYIDFQFGYDKNFIGNGYRSLFLSDFGNGNLFFESKYQDLEAQLSKSVHGADATVQ